MGRPHRILARDAVYHVTARGDGGSKIVLGETDRLLLLTVFDLVIRRYEWVCHSYCVMGNHYHLLVETPTLNLHEGMRDLNGIYARRFNRRHRRRGHVFGDRYSAEFVVREPHFLEACRYVVRNPVRARVCQTAGDWPWSSYRALAGHARTPRFLTTHLVLGAFSRDPDTARARYREFVAASDVEALPWPDAA